MDSLIAERTVCLLSIEKTKKELAELQFMVTDESELRDALKLSQSESVENSDEWNDYTGFIEMHDDEISQNVTQCEMREEKLRKLYAELDRIQTEISKLETELQKAKDMQHSQLNIPTTTATKNQL